MWLLALIRECGVHWTRTEQERRLFPLCLQVQATFVARHGTAYQTADVSWIPDAYVEEAREILRGLLLEPGK